MDGLREKKAVGRTLKDEINELATDQELSASYLRRLIVECTDVKSLEEIKKYLADNTKTINLIATQRTSLMRTTKNKILDIEYARYQEKQRKEWRKEFSKRVQKS